MKLALHKVERWENGVLCCIHTDNYSLTNTKNSKNVHLVAYVIENSDEWMNYDRIQTNSECDADFVSLQVVLPPRNRAGSWHNGFFGIADQVQYFLEIS